MRWVFSAVENLKEEEEEEEEKKRCSRFFFFLGFAFSVQDHLQQYPQKTHSLLSCLWNIVFSNFSFFFLSFFFFLKKNSFFRARQGRKGEAYRVREAFFRTGCSERFAFFFKISMQDWFPLQRNQGDSRRRAGQVRACAAYQHERQQAQGFVASNKEKNRLFWRLFLDFASWDWKSDCFATVWFLLRNHFSHKSNHLLFLVSICLQISLKCCLKRSSSWPIWKVFFFFFHIFLVCVNKSSRAESFCQLAQVRTLFFYLNFSDEKKGASSWFWSVQQFAYSWFVFEQADWTHFASNCFKFPRKTLIRIIFFFFFCLFRLVCLALCTSCCAHSTLLRLFLRRLGVWRILRFFRLQATRLRNCRLKWAVWSSSRSKRRSRKLCAKTFS